MPAMESQYPFATREEFWRLQESLNELSTTQSQHSERIMRLEKRRDDDGRIKSVWGPMSPFPGGLGSVAPQDSTLNPAAEAFRNFDAEPPSGLMGSLTLDTEEDRRRGAASRANSVRFDESANNHYGSTPRQSIDLPARTGSGMGSHPMSERSLSHRSDGRGSSIGLSHRANSFGLEQSRLLGSINNSPRVSGNPPPGFFVLGPFPAIIRCWLTETFSNDSLLYAAVCTGSNTSSVGNSLIQKLGLSDETFDENGIRKIKLPIYLTEARIYQASSRSASPAPQVPTLTAKFVIKDSSVLDKSIKVILGSDILRAHNADILFSQEKLMIFDEERNQLQVPLVRPESEAVYKHLITTSSDARLNTSPATPAPLSGSDEQSTPGIIGRPARIVTQQSTSFPILDSPSGITSAAPSESGDIRKSEQSSEDRGRSSTDLSQARQNDDAKSATESDKSVQTPVTKPNPGVWGSSWRAGSTSNQSETSAANKTASGYSRAAPPRNMKVLRPGKSLSNSSRSTPSSTIIPNGAENTSPKPGHVARRTSQTSTTDPKSATSAPTKSNPIGQASAFGWLNGQQRRTVANGD